MAATLLVGYRDKDIARAVREVHAPAQDRDAAVRYAPSFTVYLQ